jgi:serine/threonine protein kinase
MFGGDTYRSPRSFGSVQAAELATMRGAMTTMFCALDGFIASVAGSLKQEGNLVTFAEAAQGVEGGMPALVDIAGSIDALVRDYKVVKESLNVDMQPKRELDNFRLGVTFSGTCTVIGRSLTIADVPHITTASEVKDGDGNELINSYQVVRPIGKGAQAIVKLVRSKENDTLFALKIFNRSLLKRIGPGQGSNVHQVQGEIAVMKKLRHTNIVQLFEVIDDPHHDKLYLVMQYVENGPIAKLTPEGTCERLPPDTVRSYARQLLAGLGYLHRHNVIHNDIKPDNLLVGENGRLYLSDFGVSRLVSDDNSHLDPASTGAFGTPAFAAPEVLQGGGGPERDLWAVGITLFALLYGRLPFEAPTVYMYFKKVQNEDPDFPEAATSDEKEFIGALLQRDPSDRPSIEQLRQYKWLLEGSAPYQRSRRQSVVDIITVSADEVDHAIAVSDGATFSAIVHPKEKLSKFVKGIREKVAMRNSQVPFRNTTPSLLPSPPRCATSPQPTPRKVWTASRFVELLGAADDDPFAPTPQDTPMATPFDSPEQLGRRVSEDPFLSTE